MPVRRANRGSQAHVLRSAVAGACWPRREPVTRGRRSARAPDRGPTARVDSAAASAAPGSASSTRLRPCRLATYSAASARRSSRSRVLAWSGKPATPMEAVTDTSLPGREISAIAARIRSAISSARGDLGVGQQDRELLPAVAAGEVPAPQRAAEHRADVRQDLITHRVPALVIDLLEVVQVDQEQRDRRLGGRGLGERPLQRVGDGALVGQAGQAVGRGADLRDGQVAQVGQHGRGLADRLADPLLLRLGVAGRAAEQHRADHLAARR